MEAWDEEDTDNKYLLPSRKSIVEAQEKKFSKLPCIVTFT
jgi:hypothetical protein